MKTRNLLLAGALVTALGLSGCSASGGSTADDSGQTLTLSMPSAPPSLAVGALDQGISSMIWTSLYDTLLERDADGALQPSAAEKWDTSEDGLTLTFSLRDDLSFSNGDPVDADAVVASLQQSQSSPATSAAFSRVASIEATDEAMVVITLTAPDTSLPFALTQSAGVIGDPSDLTSDTAALDPIGSGPYELDDANTTAGSSYTLKLRDDHWNADDYAFGTVVVKVIADTTAQLNAIQAGEIDYITLPDASQLPPLEAAGLPSGETAPSAWAGLYIADRAGAVQPALADERVRQAINLAIDRDAIVEKLMYGSGSATTQIFDPGTDVYEADLDDVYSYNLDKAKSLMEEAGYADGFTVAMPSSVLSATYEPTLTQQLGEIGITIEWNPVPFDQVVTSLSSQTYPMFWFFNGFNPAPIDATNSLGENGTFNPFHSTDPELTTLLDTAANAATVDEANTGYKAVNEWAVDNAWFAPVFDYVQIFVTSKDVKYTPRTYAGLLSLNLFTPSS